MDLTSGAFLGLLVVLTLSAAAAAVVFWGRLAADRPATVAGRVGVLVGVNLLVVLTASAALNQRFGFFADWGDLAGAFGSSTPYHATSRGGGAAAAAEAPVTGDSAAGPGAQPPALAGQEPGRRQYSFDVPGPASRVSGRVVVYLPAGYSDPAQAGRRYPVIETFHGYPGRPEQWLDSMDLGSALDTEAAAGRMAPVVVVSPQLEIPKGRDTECVDGGPGDPALETWLTVDLPDWVSRTFRVSTRRDGWATAGLSAGGWCAAMAALLHPARYGAAMVFGGYFSPMFDGSYKPFGASTPSRYDLAALVRSAPPPVAMWVETSPSDKLSYRSTKPFLEAVRPPLSVQQVELTQGGHSIPVWAGLVPDALHWLATEVPGFRPRAG